YDPAEPNPWDTYQDVGHSHWHNALLWGEDLSDVSILGPGLIWGKGLTRGPGDRNAGVGDKAISLKNCRNISIRDVSFLHGGHFAILATGVDNFTVDNLIIDTNRDGIDFDCCRNVRVSNCTVNSPWDDGLCPKSSYALGYNKPTELVTITNCLVTGAYEEGSVVTGMFKRWAPAARPTPSASPKKKKMLIPSPRCSAPCRRMAFSCGTCATLRSATWSWRMRARKRGPRTCCTTSAPPISST